MIDEVVILAAGKGTRMQSELPKVLHLVGNRPMIFAVMDVTKKLGVFVPVIVVGYQEAQVREALTRYGGMTPLFVTQENPTGGTGDAVKTAAPYLAGEYVAVLSGDMPFVRAETLKQLAEMVEKETAVMGLATTTITPESHFGRIVRDVKGHVQKIVEWKDATAVERQIVEGNVGVYVFRTGWLVDVIGQIVPSATTGELYLTDLVARARAENAAVVALVSEDPREGIGVNTPQELTDANRAA